MNYQSAGPSTDIAGPQRFPRSKGRRRTYLIEVAGSVEGVGTHLPVVPLRFQIAFQREHLAGGYALLDEIRGCLKRIIVVQIGLTGFDFVLLPVRRQ